MAKKIDIAGTLNAATTDGVLGFSEQIKDESKGKMQSSLNKEFGEGIERIERKSDIAYNAVKTLEGLSNANEAMQTLAGQVVQIEENKQNIASNKADADAKLTELGSEVDKNFQKVFPSEILGDSLVKTGFYNVGSSSIGSEMPKNIQNSATKYYAVFNVYANTNILLKTYLTSAYEGAVRPYVICNKSNIITQLPEKLKTYDYTQGVVLYVEEESILYVACNVENQSDFYLSMQSKNSISERIEVLEKDSEELNNDIADLNNTIGYSYGSLILEDSGFYSFQNKTIGDKAPSVTNNSTKKSVILSVVKGQKIKLKTFLTSSVKGACYPWVLTDSDKIIVSLPDALNTFDLTEGVDITVEEDGFIYLCSNDDKLEQFNIESGEILKKIGEINKEITLMQNEIQNTNKRLELVEDRLNEVSDKRLVYTKDDATASSSYYNLQGIEVGSSYTGATKSTSSATYYTLELQVKKGYKVTIKTYTTSGVAGLLRGYCLTNSEDVVVDIAEPKTTLDFLEGKELSVESDGTLYVTCKDGYQDLFSVEVIVEESQVSKKISDIEKSIADSNSVASAYTKMFGLYLPNNKVLLNGASFSQYNGYFELAMKKLGISGTNRSVAGTNIFKLANELYSNNSVYKTTDVLIINHVHNYDVNSLPKNLENYTPSQYENDSVIGDYIKTETYYSQRGGFENATYTDDELYAIGYDYCIKKYIELCYNLKGQDGYDDLNGKPVQIILYTHWHDARVTYNESVRKLANKWGLYLVKEDENIGFSKNRVNPIANKQQSILYCNGVPWGSKTEVIDGVTYGFHPSGIASGEWSSFVQLDEQGMIDMLPYIQIKRASILMDAFKNRF